MTSYYNGASNPCKVCEQSHRNTIHTNKRRSDYHEHVSMVSEEHIPPPRNFPVTDDLEDAPDGAEILIRYKRVGMSWEQVAVEEAK